MKASTWFYGRFAALILVAVGLAGWWWFESSGKNQARAVVAAIKTADTTELSRLMDEGLPRLRRWADDQLRQIADNPKENASHRLRANLALIEVEPLRVALLEQEMLECPTDEFRLVRERLSRLRDAADPLGQLTTGDATKPPLGHELAGFFGRCCTTRTSPNTLGSAPAWPWPPSTLAATSGPWTMPD